MRHFGCEGAVFLGIAIFGKLDGVELSVVVTVLGQVLSEGSFRRAIGSRRRCKGGGEKMAKRRRLSYLRMKKLTTCNNAPSAKKASTRNGSGGNRA
jgi:hypothetical protein